MYATFDLRCPTCSAEFPNAFVKKSEMDDQRCSRCQDTLVRLPAGTRTTFRFHDRKAHKG